MPTRALGRCMVLGDSLRRMAGATGLIRGLTSQGIEAISKHLKVLEGAGLIARGRTAQLRPSRLVGAPLKDVDDWVEPYRRFWQASFDRLDARMSPREKRADSG